jgi:hypothetical protein
MPLSASDMGSRRCNQEPPRKLMAIRCFFFAFLKLMTQRHGPIASGLGKIVSSNYANRAATPLLALTVLYS